MSIERPTAEPTLLMPVKTQHVPMNLLRAAFLWALVALLTAGSPALVSAGEFEIFFDRDDFLAATEAKLATPNNFPNVGDLGSEPYQTAVGAAPTTCESPTTWATWSTAACRRRSAAMRTVGWQG